MRPYLLRPSWIGAGGIIALGVLLGGCASRGDRATRPAPQPPLLARSAFFDGSLVAEAALGPFRLTTSGGPPDRRPPGPGEGEPIPVTRGGFSQRGEAEAGMGFPRGLNEEGAFGGRPRTADGPRGGPGGSGGGLPRQSMVVTFRSSASEPLSIGVVEVKSAIGNFVPVPDQFVLAPGASQELEAMRAAYPAAIDELELLIAVRVNGRDETQVLKLKPVSSTPAP